MEIDSFIVNDIRIDAITDRRAINPERLKGLIKSIEDIGLQTPITVWTADNGGDHGAVHLVAGLHRLEAFKKLDRKLIEAFRISGNEVDRDLWQIDENLMRSDLTETERADHLRHRKRIFKARKNLGGTNPPTKPQHQKGFATETAEITGMSKRDINRSIRRAEKIAPRVMEAIKDWPAADIGVELDALAGLDPDDQSLAVEMVLSGKAKDFREATKAFHMPDHDADRKRPTASQARQQARASGHPIAARDGKIYFGATEKESEDSQRRRSQTYRVRDGVELIANIGITPETWVEEAWDWQVHDFSPADLDRAIKWLLHLRTPLKALIKRVSIDAEDADTDEAGP